MNQTMRASRVASVGPVRRGGACVLAACAMLVAAAGLLVGERGAAADAAVRSVSVPIETEQGSDGNWLVTVDVEVAGGRSVPVQLDTGSTGLVIVSSAVGKSARSTGQTYSSGYVSGAVSGKIATGTVALGGLKSPASTAFSVVPASSPAGKAWANGPVKGILGIAMTNDLAPSTVYSPLLQLPTPYWQGVTVNVAKGLGAEGSLVIGPVATPNDAVALPMYRAKPSAYPNGRPAFQKDTTMCWQIGHDPNNCGLTDMDLGFPTPAVNTNFEVGVHDGETFDPGQTVTVTSPAGTPVWSFTTGSSLAVPNVLQVAPLSEGYTEFNTSIGFFFAHSVAYDVTGKQYLITPNPLDQ